MAMGSGKVNQTELIAALINQKESVAEGIVHAQNAIKGSQPEFSGFNTVQNRAIQPANFKRS